MTQFRVFTRWVRACADLSPSNYGGPWDQTGRNIEHELAVQFQNSCFPVSAALLAAALDFRTLNDVEAFETADARVSTVMMNHPIPNFG